MTDSEWIQVRLRRDTAAALQEFARRSFRLTTIADLPNTEPGKPLSMDAAVRVLLWRDEQARKRSERSKKNPA